MSGLNEWMEVFKTGKHRDSAGNEREWTESDLDRIASYDPKLHESPVVVGHPKTNSPAYGWVSSLKREGEKLLAKVDKLAPAFVDAVAEGRYKKRSISLYPDGTLRHIGFLGGMPPAVKGLADVAFSEDEGAVTYEFAEDRKFSLLGGMMRRLRDFILVQFGKDAADDVVSGWEIQSISDPEPEGPEEIQPATAFGEADKEDDMSAEKLAELESQVARLNEALASKDEQIKAHEAALKVREEEKRMSAFAEFCAPLATAGKLTPALRDRATCIMKALREDADVDFAEGETTVKKSTAALFREMLAELPAQVAFGEVATKDRAAGNNPDIDAKSFGENVDPERLDLHKRAAAIQKEKGIPYAEAVREAMTTK